MQNNPDINLVLRNIHRLSRTDEVTLPVEIFQDRNLGMLESAVVYLKDSLKLSNNEIAKLLKRDNRTIWATYHKAKKKLK